MDKKQKIFTLIALITAILISNLSALPVFHSDGSIINGEKSLKLTENGEINLILAGNELIKINQQVSPNNLGWTYPPRFNKKSFQVFQDKKEADFKAFMPINKAKQTCPYSLSTKLLADGKIRIESFFTPKPNLSFKYNIMLIQIPFHLINDTDIIVDNQTLTVNSSKQGRLLPNSQSINEIELFPGSYDKNTKISPQTFGTCYIKNKQEKNKERLLVIGITPKQGKISFTIDLGKKSLKAASPETYAGLDFWKMDKLMLPQYNNCHNLIQNPSFELGSRYYKYHSAGKKEEHQGKSFYKIVEGDAKFGTHSLAIRALKKAKNPVRFGTFGIPVKANTPYTFSFYAKGNKPGLLLRLSSTTSKHPNFAKFLPQETVPLSTKWKRYTRTVTNPNTGLALYFQGKYYGKADEGTILLDGLQLEESKLTNFTEKPVGTKLTTTTSGNVINLGSPVNAELTVVTTNPQTTGSIKITAENYFKEKVFTKTLTFKTDAKGQTVIPLPFAEKLSSGIYIIRTDLKLADGFTDRDFHRLSIMKFLRNKHRNKNLCSISLNHSFMYACPKFDIILDRLRDMGIGGFNKAYFTKKDFEKFLDHGFSYFGATMVNRYRNPKTGEISKVIEDSEGNHVLNFSKIQSITPEVEKQLEAAVYQKAKRYSYIPNWYFCGECASSMPHLTKDPANFAKALIATYRGVKRFDPRKKVALTGGPCNMMPQRGTRLVIDYIKGVNNQVKFDEIGMHIYRATPEHPDMDSDTAYFLKQLEKHGYGDVPVIFEEGMHFPLYNIPAWGFSSHKGNSDDKYYMQSLSYAMGWGERIATAYYTRAWLIVLKYLDRVSTANGWQHRDLFMDFDLTPFALPKIINTLGNVLGNAEFKKDIRFAPDTRCYIFEDITTKQPTAVIWSCMPLVDRGKQPAPKARFNFNSLQPEFIDLMEGKRNYHPNRDGNLVLPVTPFPLFIRSVPGTLNAMIQAMNSATLLDSSTPVISVNASPVDANTVKVTFNNSLTRSFSGKATIKFNDKKQAFKLTIPALGNQVEEVKLNHIPSAGTITPIQLECLITDSKGKRATQNITFDFFTAPKKSASQSITIDGKPEDWENIPEFKITNRTINKRKQAADPEKIGYPGDQEASFKVTWDSEHLYLLVKVVDDRFSHEIFDKIGKHYNNDCLQIYFDTLCDARSQATKGFDTNDYNYDIYPISNNQPPTVYRRFAPEQQAAGGLYAPKPNMVEPNVKSAFKQTPNGYIYEVAFPKKYIAPIGLEPGEIIGFGLFLADRDKGETNATKQPKHVKSALTLTPPGYGCYMNPHLFPAMLLQD